MCSYCLVSHIRREPGTETKDAAEASEAAAEEQQKHQKLGQGRDMRRGFGEGGGGASAAAKTKQLGYHDEGSEEALALVQARRKEALSRSPWATCCAVCLPLYKR